MLFFLTGFLLVARCISSPVETTAWFSAPNFRGTWDLLVGCILTLIICVWSALHLNVPKGDSTLRTRNLRRAKWILLGIFAPELVVSSAFAEYLTARWLRREILQDIAYRKAKVRHSRIENRMKLAQHLTDTCRALTEKTKNGASLNATSP
jgi:hypothetical protein